MSDTIEIKETDYVREGHVHAKLKEASNYKENYTTILSGLEFIVYPDVFNPEIFPSSHVIVGLWISLMRTIKPDSLLEIGAGAGYLSILAALNGAHRVTATDITSQAVANIQANIEKYKLGDRMRALCGSIFEPLQTSDRFDVIFWNLPFNHIEKSLEEMNALERTLFDPGYKLTETYLRDAHKYLSEKGRLFIVFSNELGNLQHLKQLTYQNGWSLHLIENTEYSVSKSFDIYDGVDMSFYELIKL